MNSESMTFWQKISSYDYLNLLIPGVVFAVALERITSFKVLSDSIWKDVLICYFIGVVISRIGSLIVEPLLKKSRLIKFSGYTEYIKAESAYDKLNEKTMVSNMYRTYISLSFCLLVSVLINVFFQDVKFNSTVVSCILIVMLMLLFIFSYRKQTQYVRDSVSATNKQLHSVIEIPPDKKNH